MKVFENNLSSFFLWNITFSYAYSSIIHRDDSNVWFLHNMSSSYAYISMERTKIVTWSLHHTRDEGDACECLEWKIINRRNSLVFFLFVDVHVEFIKISRFLIWNANRYKKFLNCLTQPAKVFIEEKFISRWTIVHRLW